MNFEDKTIIRTMSKTIGILVVVGILLIFVSMSVASQLG